MERVEIRKEGLVGTLFRKGNPSSAVIVLGGSSGGLNELRAEALANEGFAAFSLAYFAIDPLPSKLKEIPLEYFEKAIHYLKREPGVNKLGLWGGSRGAELSLILGTLFPERIDAIAAHVPSSAVYGTFEIPESAAWTYRGNPIAPNAPFEFIPDTAGDSEATSISATPSFLKGMEDQAAFAKAAIPVEKLKCPLLLISAEDDQMWPSSLFAKQIVDRLLKYRSPIPYSHISYPGVGHAPGKGLNCFHPHFKKWLSYGGNLAANAQASEDWFKETTTFFKERL